MEPVEGQTPGGDQGAGNPPVVTEGGDQGGNGQGGDQGGTPGGSEKLYEMPDGRKLTADQVHAEYNNLLPDYTRKSQELAKLTGKPNEQQGQPDPNDPLAKFKDPNYQPQSWAEVLEAAKLLVDNDLKAKDEATKKEQQEREAVSKQIDEAVAKIKETDKALDEEDMFTYAAEKAKKGVQYASVDALYDDYKAIRDARKQGMSEAHRNMQNRGARDVSVGAGSPSGGPAPIDLASLRGKSIVELAAEAAQRASKQ